MNLRLIVRSEAESDITEAAIWYDEQERGLGLDLVLEIRAAIEKAAGNPFLYPLLRNTPEIRRVLSHRFPYRIIFIVRENTLIVFAVLHAARHERHWKKRIKPGEED